MTDDSGILAAKLDQLIAVVGRSAAVPAEARLWSADEIAAYLSVGRRTAAEKIVMLPGFPQPIRLPVVSGGRGHPRWKAAEVMAWAEQFQERRAA